MVVSKAFRGYFGCSLGYSASRYIQMIGDCFFHGGGWGGSEKISTAIYGRDGVEWVVTYEPRWFEDVWRIIWRSFILIMADWFAFVPDFFREFCFYVCLFLHLLPWFLCRLEVLGLQLYKTSLRWGIPEKSVHLLFELSMKLYGWLFCLFLLGLCGFNFPRVGSSKAEVLNNLQQKHLHYLAEAMVSPVFGSLVTGGLGVTKVGNLGVFIWFSWRIQFRVEDSNIRMLLWVEMKFQSISN